MLPARWAESTTFGARRIGWVGGHGFLRKYVDRGPEPTFHQGRCERFEVHYV